MWDIRDPQSSLQVNLLPIFYDRILSIKTINDIQQFVMECDTCCCNLRAAVPL